MRIGFDAKRIFHNFRGLGNYSRNILEGLLKYYPNNEYFLYTPQIKDKRSLEWLSRYPEVQLKTPQGFFNNTFSSSWRSLFLEKDIKRDHLDIYHGLSHEIPLGIHNQRSIVTIHDLIFLKYPEYFPWIDRQVYLRKVKYSVENVNFTLAICEQTKADLIELLNVPEEKIRIAYQSCSPSFYENIGDTKIIKWKKDRSLPEQYILYVGALEERKNALSLLNAFIRIKDRVPHHLILIGNGKEYKNKIERVILENGLSDRVELLSGIESSELPFFYQGAELFVYPSFYEGWGIPNVEALFSETPVLTSESSCLPESAGENSEFCNPHSVEDIAQKMEKILGDRDLQEKMKRNGRVYAENFHLKQTTDHLIKIYEEVII